MKTFVEISIEHINESTANRQLHDDILTDSQKSDETIHILG